MVLALALSLRQVLFASFILNVMAFENFDFNKPPLFYVLLDISNNIAFQLGPGLNSICDLFYRDSETQK